MHSKRENSKIFTSPPYVVHKWIISAIVLLGVQLLFMLPAEMQARPLAAVTLSAADLAVMGYNSDGTDDVALVALAGIPAGSVIFMTDYGWDTSAGGFTSSTEDTITWTTPAIAAGTIVNATSLPGISSGTFATLSTFGDQLLIYQTDDDTPTGNPTIIYAFNNNTEASGDTVGQWQGGLLTSQFTESNVPAGTTEVTTSGGAGNAFGLVGHIDNMVYTGPTTAADRPTWLSRLHTVANWTTDNGTPQDIAPGGANLPTAITITAPEPDNHPTAFTATATSPSQITTSWTDSTGANLPSGYLVLCNLTGAFPPPLDTLPQADDTNCADGSGVQNVPHASGGTVAWTGLNSGIQYFFTIFPYSNAGLLIDYKINESPELANASTPIVETFEDETNASTTFSEAGLSFSLTNDLVIEQFAGFGCCTSDFFLDSGFGDGGTTGSAGKIIITTPGTGFIIEEMDAWTSNSDGTSFAVGDVTFVGTRAIGGTVSETITVTPTGDSGPTVFDHLLFAGTNLDGVLLTELEIILSASLNFIEIDNFQFRRASLQADLSITKADDVDPIVAGNTLTYTIQVNNAGPDLADNVVVTDTLPAGVTLVSTSGCAEDPNGVGTCSMGDIAASGSAQFTVQVTVDTATAGLITNQAGVTSASNDGNPGNNSISEGTTVQGIGTLTVTKVVTNDHGGSLTVGNFPLFVDGASVNSGDTLTVTVGTHTFTETNQTGYAATYGGDCDASGNVTLAAGESKSCTLFNDDQPAVLTVTKSATPNDGTDFAFSINGPTFGSETPFTLDDEASQPNDSVSQTAVYGGLSAGTYLITETVTSGWALNTIDCGTPSGTSTSLTLNNGQAVTCTFANQMLQPDLSIQKTVIPTAVKPGDSVTYTLTFSNNGVGLATGGVITDFVPISLTAVSVISSGVAIVDTGANPAYVWSVQDMTLGEVGIITITGIVSANLTEVGQLITNTAIIAGAGDLDAANNVHTATFTTLPAGPCYASLNNSNTTDYSGDAQALRDAVNAATADDTLKVAGYCAGIGGGVNNGHTQVIALDKGLTVRGGYTTTNWLVSDSQANPTVLDALGQGRGIFITGINTTSIESLAVINGTTTGGNNGAGIYIGNTTTTISNSLIYGNTATGTNSDGGGIYNDDADLTIIRSKIFLNSAEDEGGGLNDFAPSLGLTILQESDVYSNAAAFGGGVYHLDGHLVVTESNLYTNTVLMAAGDGGGLYLHGGLIQIDDSLSRSKIHNQRPRGSTSDLIKETMP